MSVMVLQGLKYSPQKSRPLESGHRRHGVCIAIECSYKLDQKNEFKFLCELCTFSQIRSQFSTYIFHISSGNYGRIPQGRGYSVDMFIYFALIEWLKKKNTVSEACRYGFDGTYTSVYRSLSTV